VEHIWSLDVTPTAALGDDAGAVGTPHVDPPASAESVVDSHRPAAAIGHGDVPRLAVRAPGDFAAVGQVFYLDVVR